MSTGAAWADAVARGDLAEDMVRVAARLAPLVHGDGGVQEIWEILDGLDAMRKDALIVVLAAMVDPEESAADALGWVKFDEFGHPGEAVTVREPIRDLAEDTEHEPEVDEHYVDQAAVRAYLRGQRVKVTKREQLEAIRAGVARGMVYPDFDRLHGLAANSTSQFISRARKLYTDWGITFPAMAGPVVLSFFTEAQVIEIRERCAAGATDLETAMAFGVTRSTITSVVSGETYGRYGGPIRAKRENVPGPATRTLWANTSAVTPVFAEDLAVPA